MYTSHGHPIENTIHIGEPPANQARCGGPRLCAKCKQEAADAQPKTVTPNDPTQVIRLKVEIPDSAVNGLEAAQARFDAAAHELRQAGQGLSDALYKLRDSLTVKRDADGE
jgi:hypothetical protein